MVIGLFYDVDGISMLSLIYCLIVGLVGSSDILSILYTILISNGKQCFLEGKTKMCVKIVDKKYKRQISRLHHKK